MRKIILGLCLLILAVSLNAEGKLLFDLKAQYFSKTLAKEKSKDYTKHGKYNLPNVIVDTSMTFNGKTYSNGDMTITLKKPVVNWAIIQSFKAKNNDYNRYGDTVFRISSTSGNAFYVTVMDDHIAVNGNDFEVGNTKYKKIVIDVVKSESKFVAKINGSVFLTTKIDNFGKLYKIETMSKQGGSNTFDYISALEIYSK